MNGLLKAPKKCVDLVLESSKLVGYQCGRASIAFGATDATAFLQKKIPAVCLSAVDPMPGFYYHTRYDTPENLDLKTISAAIAIAIQTTLLFDQKGLNE